MIHQTVDEKLKPFYVTGVFHCYLSLVWTWRCLKVDVFCWTWVALTHGDFCPWWDLPIRIVKIYLAYFSNRRNPYLHDKHILTSGGFVKYEPLQRPFIIEHILFFFTSLLPLTTRPWACDNRVSRRASNCRFASCLSSHALKVSRRNRYFL